MAPSRTAGELDDPELVAGLLAGDAVCLAEVRLWIRGAGSPYRDLLANDLEDLEQDALIAVLDALATRRFRGESRLRTYVRKLVHYRCIDRLRASRVRQVVPLEGLELPAAGESALDRLAQESEARVALAVLARVSLACRALWQLIMEGWSYGAMSERLGVAEGTLRVRALRCRRHALQLRDELRLGGNARTARPTEGLEEDR